MCILRSKYNGILTSCARESSGPSPRPSLRRTLFLKSRVFVWLWDGGSRGWVIITCVTPLLSIHGNV